MVAARRFSRSQPLAACLATALATVVLATAACNSDLEVKGNTERLIGERVTLALVEGETGFSGELTLTDGRGATLQSAQLDVEQKDERTLSFVLPPATAAGPASVKVKKKGDAGDYSLSLKVTRVGVALDASGNIETLPLPPSELANATVSAGPSGQQLSISPLGGLLVTLAADEVRFFSLEKTPREVTAALKLVNTTCIAALPSGVIVGTSTSIQIFNYVAGQGTTQGGSLTLKNTKALAVSDDGRKALALTHCDTNGDGQPDSDCVVPLDLGLSSPAMGPQVVLDAQNSAIYIAARGNGLGAVVADTNVIYGIDMSSFPAQVSSIPWSGLKPVGVARAAAMIEGQVNDLFAVGDETSKQVRTIGFKGRMLQDVSVITLDVVPTHLSFGRRTDLYVAAGRKLFKVDVSLPTPIVTPLSRQATQPPIAFVVQP